MRQFIIFNGDVPSGTQVTTSEVIEASQGELCESDIISLAVCESICENTIAGFFTIVRIS